MSNNNVILKKYAWPGKVIREIGNGDRLIVFASAYTPICSLISMYRQNFIQICQDLYQRFLAWMNSDCQKLFKSIDDGVDLGPLVIWIKNSGHAEVDEIIDGGNRMRALFGWIMGQGVIRRDSKLMHPTYRTTLGGPLEKFAKVGQIMQDRTVNTIMEVRCIFVMDKERYYEIVDSLTVDTLENMVVPFEDLSAEEVEDVKGYIIEQYKACQNGRQNNATEVLRADQADSAIKLLIDDYCKSLPLSIAAFTQTRTAKDEYIATILYTIQESPKKFFGADKEGERKSLYEKLNDKSKRDYKTLKNRAHAMWERFEKAQDICAARSDLNGYLTQNFVAGKCFSKVDGWLLTPFFFDYAFRVLGVEENDDNYERVGSICERLYTDVSKMVNTQKELRKDKHALLIEGSQTARQEVATDCDKYADLVYRWSDTFISTGLYGSFREMNEEKWKWLNELFTLEFPEETNYEVEGTYKEAAG